jgi:hypothetical protein
MPNVITEASIVTCIHQAPIQLRASQHKLTVDGHAVILQRDLLGAVVDQCPNTAGAPCTKIISIGSGISTDLVVDGEPAMLETAIGLTDGSPPAPIMWQVLSAEHAKLAAR